MEEVKQLAKDLREADFVLLGVGAGMSIPAGINYGDTEFFAKNFPALVKQGYQAQYQLLGSWRWQPQKKWGYLAKHVFLMRYNIEVPDYYMQLLDCIASKDSFILSSNVDAMFEKAGYPKSRLYTPQGDYAVMQCQRPCTTETWDSWPTIEAILPYIDDKTQLVTNSDVLPRCPNCGGDVMMNVRAAGWYLEEPWLEQAKNFNNWADKTTQGKLVLIEIGAGFNTPGVVRWPMEYITEHHPKARFYRVNPEHSQFPKHLFKKATSVPLGTTDFVSELLRHQAEG